MHPGQIFASLFSTPGVGRFQAVRTGPSAIAIHVEPLAGRSPSLEEVRARCADIFPAGVAVTVEQRRIEAKPGDKHVHVRVSPGSA